MPSEPLLMTATLMGMPSIAQVVSSWLVIWKQPSPSMAHTNESGMPTFAPIAAGTAKPLVPRPPELIHVFGCSYRTTGDPHVGGCPPPATYRVPGPAIAPIRGITRCGDPSPSGSSPYPSG